MRRVAAELGAGTMTLYHYVRTKDELLALVDNAIMGELVIPADELPAGWRAGHPRDRAPHPRRLRPAPVDRADAAGTSTTARTAPCTSSSRCA